MSVCWKNGVPVGAARIELPDGTAQLCRCDIVCSSTAVIDFFCVSPSIKAVAVSTRKGGSMAGVLMYRLKAQ